MGVANAAELLNLVGFLTASALFAMLWGLVRRGRPAVDGSHRLPLLTAVLGLGWNLGELADYLLSRTGMHGPEPWLNVLSFSALAVLAAVVVHSVARGVRHGATITAVAYACSTAAIAVHLRAVASGDPSPSPIAFGMLTVAFGLISVPLAVATRAQTNGRRALWMLALALFAVAANHFGHFHDEAGGWAAELLGHQAVLPLAFAILYQEYRFALADLFLKRALTLLAVVALAMAAYAGLSTLPPGSLSVALLLGAWVLTAMVYPALRRGVSRFVDSALLRREDYGRLRAELAQAVQGCDTEDAVLECTANVMTRALNARRVWWADAPLRPSSSADAQGDRSASVAAAVPPSTPVPASLLRADLASAAEDEPVTTEVAVPTTERPVYWLRIGVLVGGRRLLSDDRAFVEAAALLAARRIDAVRLSQERLEQRLRQEAMERLATEAELRALRSQINPHFLFNTLTTIGYLIETAPSRATRTLLRLTSLLRAVLRSEGELTTLGRETELVTTYLDIERERFEERLQVDIDVPAALKPLPVPCLLVQPLVENAVKHGVARAVHGGAVQVRASLDGQTLVVTVRNTGAPLAADGAQRGAGVGLANVERRLAGHYGERAALRLTAVDGVTTAEVRVPVAVATTGESDVDTRRAIGE